MPLSLDRYLLKSLIYYSTFTVNVRFEPVPSIVAGQLSCYDQESALSPTHAPLIAVSCHSGSLANSLHQ